MVSDINTRIARLYLKWIFLNIGWNLAKMAQKLTQKQIEALKQLSHDELITLIHILAEHGNDVLQSIALYLLSPEDRIKHIEKEYKKQRRKKGNYDYYKSHQFFISLAHDIANPLIELSVHLPSATARLAQKCIEDFNELAENYDTSSGSWQQYIDGLLMAWIRALGHGYQNNTNTDVATAYFALQANCDYLSPQIISENKIYFPNAAIRQIRDFAIQHGHVDQIIPFNLILKDFTSLAQAFQANQFRSEASILEYAKILLDDFRTEEAVNVLKNASPLSSSRYLQPERELLLVQAVYENGDTQEALNLCKEYFKKSLNTQFCYRFIKYAPAANTDMEDFYQVAYEHGAPAYLNFAAEMQDWERFNSFVKNSLISKDNTWLENLFSHRDISTIRKWSTSLAQQGYPLAAVILRRKLVEDTLSRGKSVYYKYAVSDLKKSIDFMDCMEEPDKNLLHSSLTFIADLYQKHNKKYSFWQACDESISKSLPK